MTRFRALVTVLGLVVTLGLLGPRLVAQGGPPTNGEIIAAFGKQGMRINAAEAQGIRDNVRLALKEAAASGIGNSKVDFAAIEIAHDLGLDTSPGSNTVKNVVAALKVLLEGRPANVTQITPPRLPQPPVAWQRYYDETVNLCNNLGFLNLVQGKGFHPVKISWEDIGRYAGSVWGDRISDVGIWVRQDEGNPQSARLALSVRRDSNFRDKVLMVPATQIKIHQRVRGTTVEKTLPERLAELGLTSKTRDRNVIVSNQFAIVPVPARNMEGAWAPGTPPRAAFTFSIFPYGSTNFVITDVIEGSHDAIVGPGNHQLLFANVKGNRAPFTASRAEDRPDLLKLEKELKAQGMDVDVQRYYLIQIPLRKDAAGIQTSNMGTPPFTRQPMSMSESVSVTAAAPPPSSAKAFGGGAPSAAPPPMMAQPPATTPPGQAPSQDMAGAAAKKMESRGLEKVAIGTGETEGPYSTGTGYSGARAEEPIRVTVVYFVTPVGIVTQKDMETFAAAFAQWDSQAIWGGSFVTKESF
jgi:hypothetical protein